jgi:uncharacterized membrane protein
LFPWIESVHVLAIVIVVGTISIVDLRLLGVASLDISARRLMPDVIPYTGGAFAVAAITGSLMFSSDATYYAQNRLFQAKFVMLVLAGLNMAIFHFFGVRDIERWEAAGRSDADACESGSCRFTSCLDHGGLARPRHGLHDALVVGLQAVQITAIRQLQLSRYL